MRETDGPDADERANGETDRHDRGREPGSVVPAPVRAGLGRVREAIHDLRSVLVSYDVYRSLDAVLPDERRDRFVDGDHYLFVLDGDEADLVAYDRMENEFTRYPARHDRGSGPPAVDTGDGRPITEAALMNRLDDAELVDTVPVRLFAPGGAARGGSHDDGS